MRDIVYSFFENRICRPNNAVKNPLNIIWNSDPPFATRDIVYSFSKNRNFGLFRSRLLRCCRRFCSSELIFDIERQGRGTSTFEFKTGLKNCLFLSYLIGYGWANFWSGRIFRIFIIFTIPRYLKLAKNCAPLERKNWLLNAPYL